MFIGMIAALLRKATGPFAWPEEAYRSNDAMSFFRPCKGTPSRGGTASLFTMRSTRKEVAMAGNGLTH